MNSKFEQGNLQVRTIYKGSRKQNNGLFLVVRPLRPYPLELSGHKKKSNIFIRASKTVFFLVAKPLPLFLFAASLTQKGINVPV